MTDLEMTRLCAEALGWKHKTVAIMDGRKRVEDIFYIQRDVKPKPDWVSYDPLHDDAQAMALVKKMELCITKRTNGWTVYEIHEDSTGPDLNRAIVECVAKMQKDKGVS